MYQKRNNKLEILKLYTSDYKQQFFLREISRMTGIPLKTTQDTIRALEEQKILKSRIHGRNRYFTLNLNIIDTKLALMQAEIQKTADFLKIHPLFESFLKQLSTDSLIILFGSFAKGTEKKSSDIDLLVVSGKERLPLHLLPSRPHLVEMTAAAWQRAISKGEALMKEIDENHVILGDHSSYADIMWRHARKA
jgi:predicted nucleotidyltransferase